jgi:hypothetical protein
MEIKERKELEVTVCLDFCGESGPECFSEGNVERKSRKAATYTTYIARLLTQSRYSIITEFGILSKFDIFISLWYKFLFTEQKELAAGEILQAGK